MIGDALWTLLGPSRKPTCKTPAAGPLRIAMMIETVLLGGAEVVVFQLAEELRRRGHTVFPVGPEGREGWLRTSSLDAGFPWHTYTLHRSIDWSCAEGLAQLLTGLQADVAHSHEFTASVYGTAATRLAGIPHVITMHGNQQMTRKLQRRIALRPPQFRARCR